MQWTMLHYIRQNYSRIQKLCSVILFIISLCLSSFVQQNFTKQTCSSQYNQINLSDENVKNDGLYTKNKVHCKTKK